MVLQPGVEEFLTFSNFFHGRHATESMQSNIAPRKSVCYYWQARDWSPPLELPPTKISNHGVNLATE